MFAGLPSKAARGCHARPRVLPASSTTASSAAAGPPPPPPEKPDEPDETGTALASAPLTPAIDDETELPKLLLDQLP